MLGTGAVTFESARRKLDSFFSAMNDHEHAAAVLLALSRGPPEKAATPLKDARRDSHLMFHCLGTCLSHGFNAMHLAKAHYPKMYSDWLRAIEKKYPQVVSKTPYLYAQSIGAAGRELAPDRFHCWHRA
jgi:hypothetical protein